MIKIAFFDTKPYDKIWFDKYNDKFEITYFEEKLNRHTAKFTDGFDVVWRVCQRRYQCRRNRQNVQ